MRNEAKTKQCNLLFWAAWSTSLVAIIHWLRFMLSSIYQHVSTLEYFALQICTWFINHVLSLNWDVRDRSIDGCNRILMYAVSMYGGRGHGCRCGRVCRLTPSTTQKVKYATTLSSWGTRANLIPPEEEYLLARQINNSYLLTVSTHFHGYIMKLIEW